MPPTSENRPVWFADPQQPPATEPLSRARVVAAAIALADADAGGEITMRAVATRLGSSTPMSLYRYVGSKDGLADLMVDEVYGEITVPPGGWRDALRGFGLSAWEAVQRHPWFARLAFSRPPLGPNAIALYDAALAPLDGLDLDAATRMGCVNAVLGPVMGAGLAMLEERAMRAKSGLASEEDLAEAARPYIERIVAEGKHPHFIRWVSDPARLLPGPPTFEQTLEWVLDGLAGLVTPAAGTPGAGAAR